MICSGKFDIIVKESCKFSGKGRSKLRASVGYQGVMKAKSFEYMVEANTVTECLLHNMQHRKILDSLVNFTERVLLDRKTKLMFDGHKSDWILITNRIGQGDPLSIIIYIIYNADLINIAQEHPNKLTLAFIDDTVFITTGKSTEEMHRTLQDMLEQTGGGFNWSSNHNSKFETNKFALIDFTPTKQSSCPLNIWGTTIMPSVSHKFLGVIIDKHLSWHQHINYAISKGTAYSLQLHRLTTASKGLPLTLMWQLYTSVAIPKLLYAIDVWFTPLYTTNNDEICQGSITAMKKLNEVQHIALLSMTRALWTTATDVLKAHTNLLPLDLWIQNLCHQATICLSSHPTSHPISPLTQCASKCYVKRHKSSLHHLTCAYLLNPNTIEKIHPAQCWPNELSPHSSSIAQTKENSIWEHNECLQGTRIYTNGSSLNDKIGAAAILHHPNGNTWILHYHLGPFKQHTIYKAEAVGLILATKLLLDELDVYKPVSIFINNQAAIKSSDIFQTRPGHYLIDNFCASIKQIKKIHHLHAQDIILWWIPGHNGIEGNEKADSEAQLTSEGPEHNSAHQQLPEILHNSPLPHSVSATLQYQKQTMKTKWTKKLAESPHYEHLSQIDPKLLSSSFTKLTLLRTWWQTPILIWLHTNHCPINKYLKCITKSPSDSCPHCNKTPEIIIHFLLNCPQYDHPRHVLHQRIRPCNMNIPFLLSSEKAIPNLLTYVEQTNRLMTSHSIISPQCTQHR